MAFDHDENPIMRSVAYPMPQPTSNTLPTAGDDDVVSDVDEPPDYRVSHREAVPDFHRSTVLPQGACKESLLTKALQTTPLDKANSEIRLATEMSRRRSTISTTSAASTADLTSDEGITSPARTNTPSPPSATSTYLNLASYVLGRKSTDTTAPPMVQQDPRESIIAQLPATEAVSKPDPAVEALVKKRCITFACGGQKPKLPVQPIPRPKSPSSEAQETMMEKDAPKRTIKFACPGPRATVKPQPTKDNSTVEPVKADTSPKETIPRHNSRSPSMSRKLRSTPPAHMKTHRDSTSTVRRASQSPIAFRTRKPTYIVADEEALRSSEATRFHEFASDEPQEDDWIRKDVFDTKQKLTINDMLKKENAIRQLGKEVEEEALQEEEDEEDGEEEVAEESDDENEDDEDEENLDEDGQDDETIDGSDDDASDGNETDNEAGFADSDDESDAAGDFQFWTPGRSILGSNTTDLNAFRSINHIAASESSIDSLKHRSPSVQAKTSTRSKKSRAPRRIKIRPGTPDLPDSTDFVCGTLDEDRPLEYAYVSCMEARKREKHYLIPQDIDPSFPTSDPEDHDEDIDAKAGNDSDENIWLHGKFEDSEDDEQTRRRKHSTRRTPAHSPKRLHSPPPPKQRLRSPPPRRLFGHSPKRLRSPPPARHIRSPAASPTTHAVGGAITFAPLGHRPGLTHTKSLPRTPNAFCHQYHAARLAAANDESEDATSGHTRGAIDIVKGLEHKRQRRKEKLYQKICNRARKGQPQKKPQPGKGAERMRDLGLQLAGKVEERTGQAAYVISL